MIDNFQGVERIRLQNRPRIVEVVRVEDVAPHYRRITFFAPKLADLQSPSPRDHVRLTVPFDADRDPMPDMHAGESTHSAEGEERLYTVRRVDHDRNELLIEFVLHDAGPVTSWAAQAKVGQRVTIAGPRGSKIVNPVFDWFLMIGDETMLPSIARQAEETVPGISMIACVEVSGPGYDVLLPRGGSTQVSWADRGNAMPGTGDVLLEAVRALDLPPGKGYVFAGGEAGTLRPIRRHLIDERGMSPKMISMSGHWKRGEANHDHHVPIDPEEGR